MTKGRLPCTALVLGRISAQEGELSKRSHRADCRRQRAPGGRRNSGRRLRPDDLLARFEEVRRAEQLDESAAEMLAENYV